VRAAVLYEAGGPLVVEEVELDPPKAGEALVRIAASGVCRSDHHALTGAVPARLPIVLGHEGAGVVEAVGPGVSEVAPGDHVVLSWLAPCGRCRFCESGRQSVCEDAGWYDETLRDGTTRLHKDGLRIHHYSSSTFAEYAVVPASTAIRVDPSLPLAELALVGCAVTTGVGAALNTARVRPGDAVAVVGCGGVGLNVLQGAAIAGAREIVAVEPVAARRELALELGATRAVDPAETADLRARFDHAFEALGRTETIELALSLVGRGGQAVLVGMARPDARPGFDALGLVSEEKAIRGSWYGSCRPHVDIPLVVDLYARGRLRLAELVTRCALDDVNGAFARLEAGEAVRSVIVHGDG
jgi:S-(hydroxymethyl)glutathione dehydrogenase/alcohol dehydrogenase